MLIQVWVELHSCGESFHSNMTKKWYLELNVDEELNDKLKKFIDLTGEDDEEIVLKALKEYVENRLSE